MKRPWINLLLLISTITIYYFSHQLTSKIINNGMQNFFSYLLIGCVLGLMVVSIIKESNIDLQIAVIFALGLFGFYVFFYQPLYKEIVFTAVFLYGFLSSIVTKKSNLALILAIVLLAPVLIELCSYFILKHNFYVLNLYRYSLLSFSGYIPGLIWSKN